MSVVYPSDGSASLLDSLQRLHSDLSRIYSGRAPTHDDLDTAPILDAWERGVRLTRCLSGIAFGHPVHSHSRLIQTSELFAIDTSACWARTWSRFYRLGAPRGSVLEVGNA